MRFVLERLESVNPKLNALIDERFDEAIKDAHRADLAIRRGENKPLLGIPFTIKSNISLTGQRHDMGSWSYHGRRATSDATAIQRLMAAGAIPVGVTNVSEMVMWHETANPVHGRTNNPWHHGRTPGGSSGGEAALVAAGATVFGIGSDIGGSIRIPASFCGVFGHRPSRGLVPLTGQFPFYQATDEVGLRVFDSMGPLARSAEDLGLLLEIMAGACPEDPVSQHGRLDAFDQEWRGRKVAIIEDPRCDYVTRTSPELRLAVKRAAQRMAERGADIVVAPDDLWRDAYTLWRHHLHRAADGRYREIFGAGKKRNAVMEFLKCFTGQSDHSLEACMFMFTEEWMVDDAVMRNLDQLTNKLKVRVDKIFSQVDVMVMPPHPEVAPRHHVPKFKPFNPALTGITNVFGMAATVAPNGVSDDHLPVSVQIVAPRGRDLATIAAAKVIGEFIPSPMARG